MLIYEDLPWSRKLNNKYSIFKPSESNPLIDILMTKSLPSKSPMKPRHSKAGKLLTSRKSIGVPKTPRKSLANRSSAARKSIANNEPDASESYPEEKTKGVCGLLLTH